MDPNEKEYEHQEGKEWVIDEKDVTAINGNLRIQIPKGFIEDKDIKAIIIKVTVMGAQENVTKQLTLFSRE